MNEPTFIFLEERKEGGSIFYVIYNDRDLKVGTVLTVGNCIRCLILHFVFLF